MSDLLFDVPWWIPTVLAVIGIALFVNGNKRQIWRVRTWGAAVVALAIAWALLSWLVDTDKEKAEKGTRRAVAATVKDDWATFDSYIAPSAVFSAGGHAIVQGGPKTDPQGHATESDLTVYAREAVAAVRVKSATIRDLTVEQTGPLISVHCDIFSTQDSFAAIESSSWQFDWERTHDGWKIREIRLLKLKDVQDEALRHALPRSKAR